MNVTNGCILPPFSIETKLPRQLQITYLEVKQEPFERRKGTNTLRCYTSPRLVVDKKNRKPR
jgi:hypothetical protein